MTEVPCNPSVPGSPFFPGSPVSPFIPGIPGGPLSPFMPGTPKIGMQQIPSTTFRSNQPFVLLIPTKPSDSSSTCKDTLSDGIARTKRFSLLHYWTLLSLPKLIDNLSSQKMKKKKKQPGLNLLSFY